MLFLGPSFNNPCRLLLENGKPWRLVLPSLSTPDALGCSQVGLPGTWWPAEQHYIFRGRPHRHRAGKGGQECCLDWGLPAELEGRLEVGGQEQVEVHEVAELRGAHEVHLGGTC